MVSGINGFKLGINYMGDTVTQFDIITVEHSLFPRLYASLFY